VPAEESGSSESSESAHEPEVHNQQINLPVMPHNDYTSPRFNKQHN